MRRHGQYHGADLTSFHINPISAMPEIITDVSGRTRITIALPLNRTPIVAYPVGYVESR